MSKPLVSLEDCWLYAGYVNRHGYGEVQLKVDTKWRKFRAHRVMYESLKGDIPAGLVLDHLCRVTRCINPEHLEAVTDRVNILRGIAPSARNSRKTICKNGHSFTVENTWYRKGGGRRCKACALVARRKNYHKNYYPGKYIEANKRARARKLVN